ncbi:ABC transporter permease subunit [Brenneria izadpanahii]|uniref:ABC transporter permease subunit n=1 Tax=Brenneria izadpanahii TaxID=2722756 RepID=A0ABX7UPN7_9GAMM|nr:ABC transporter permease subunit [Brenneria izadpanahii]QTF07648.1 ABC transporter permease subunit [Brenneria izadpanahii]
MENTDNRLQHRDRRRAWIDRLTRRVVAGSGLLVLITLLSIFFYLLYVVTPIFLSPSISEQKTIPMTASAPALAVGIGDNGRMGFRIDRQGYGEFIELASGRTLQRIQLAPSVDLLVESHGDRHIYALSQPDGRIRLVQPLLPLSGDFAPQWRFPFGEKPLSLGQPAQPLRQLAVAAIAEKRLIVAAVTQDYRLVVSEVGEAGIRLKAQVELPGKSADQLLIAPDGRQIYLLDGTRLSVWQADDRLILRENRRLAEQGALRLSLLSGGRSLLVQSADGQITQWFDVPAENGMQLTAIRRFPQMADAPVLLASEPQRRVFATLTPQGDLSLFASKQSDALLTQNIAPDARSLAFSPRGQTMLVETADSWRTYNVDNPYPDIGWRGLWQKLWYENYPEPEYVWQSTAADDGYQAKFSMMPLMLGTLKAAMYAMLFATPLALSCAIYTACFMSPALRRWIKPALEIMGALPTVVIGLIAAIWLAPHFAAYLSAILVMPVLCALSVLGGGWLLESLPAGWRKFFPAGWDAIFLLPIVLLTLIFGCWLGPILEIGILGQPLYQWMGDDFVQRNALVAGVALGFALIPLIFSLAEDALFSVPSRLSQGSLALGATPWQTLWRVVLPSASAGIFAALMLSFGRAVGETMIVLMATGNTPIMDARLLQGLRSLAANIAIEMPDAVINSGHYRVLFMTALALFVFTFVVNTLAESIRRRLRRRYLDEGENA